MKQGNTIPSNLPADTESARIAAAEDGGKPESTTWDKLTTPKSDIFVAWNGGLVKPYVHNRQVHWYSEDLAWFSNDESLPMRSTDVVQLVWSPDTTPAQPESEAGEGVAFNFPTNITAELDDIDRRLDSTVWTTYIRRYIQAQAAEIASLKARVQAGEVIIEAAKAWAGDTNSISMDEAIIRADRLQNAVEVYESWQQAASGANESESAE